MIYDINSRTGNHIATLRTWDEKVVESNDKHWQWAIGKNITAVLAWAEKHYLKWEARME